MRKTMEWRLVHDVFVLMHADVPPAPKEWADFLAESRGYCGRARTTLVFAVRIQLPPVQRRQVSELTRAMRLTAVAIVTDLQLGRLIVTALSWITKVHRAFSSEELDSALLYVAPDEGVRNDVRNASIELSAQLKCAALEQKLRRLPNLRIAG